MRKVGISVAIRPLKGTSVYPKIRLWAKQSLTSPLPISPKYTIGPIWIYWPKGVGKTQIYENKVLWADGTLRQVIFYKANFSDPDHNLGGFVGTIIDITDRKKVEEHLSNSLSLLKATLESTGDGILVVSLEGEIVTFNKQFAEMWQVPEELLNKGDNQAVLFAVSDQLEDPDTFLQIVRDLYAYPERQSSDVLRFKDGRRFERITMPQKLDDRIVGRVWSFRDITRQRQMLDQLNKLSLATEQSPNSVVITDPSGNIEYVNSRFTRVSGYSYEEVLGKIPVY